MNAMEIMNYGSWVEGYGDYNPEVYDEILRSGQRIYAIAADDNHSARSSCGGWTMIKAPALEYEAITESLVKGDFYASFGPEIKELWFEDGKVHIRCSEAERVICSFPDRRAKILNRRDGDPITEAAFDIIESDGYFRLTVMDANGHCADTNAYFTDELF